MQIPETVEKIGLKIPILKNLLEARRFKKHWSRCFAPGHFYSPIPSDEEIDNWSKIRTPIPDKVGLDLNRAGQKQFVESLSPYFKEIPFTDKAGAGLRYYYENPYYSYADATFLHLVIRHLKPRRIVEVGSGFSSAVMLDTIDRFPYGDVRINFIDPYADRLRSLLRPEDAKRTTIIEKPVQGVDKSLFTSLESGDILFIDSSHVSKAGSDVNFLVFEVLPILKPGVWIHVHDIFPDFDYPDEWLKMGRAWNEGYLIRAFLLFNDAFKIMLLGPDCIAQNQAWFSKNLPHCLKNSGASLWFRREK